MMRDNSPRDNSPRTYPHINDLSDLSDLEDYEDFDMEVLDPLEHEEHGSRSDAKSNAIGQNWFQRSVARISFRAVLALLLWYMFSIGLSVYNKYMFSGEGMDFRFPILTTSLHQLVQIILATVALTVMKLPFHAFPGGNKVKVVATLASSGDIGLGNSSLLLVTLSFYTMIKSSALGFVLLFSALFGLEEVNWRLVAIVIIMSVGVLMMAFGETDFNALGFLCVLGASCCSGLRWAATKLLLNNASPDTHRPKISHPLHAIIAIAPGMFLCLFLWGMILEGPKQFISAPIWSSRPVIYNLGILLFPGLLAFCMTWAEFELLNSTGPLTLAVAGICKEVATICVSLGVFHDNLTLVNVVGIVVTIMAIGLYHYHRISS